MIAAFVNSALGANNRVRTAHPGSAYRIWDRPNDVSLVPIGACGRTVYTGDTLCVANCVPAANRVSIVDSAEEMLGINIVTMPRMVDLLVAASTDMLLTSLTAFRGAEEEGEKRTSSSFLCTTCWKIVQTTS